jgi:hypothetical protein
VTIVTGIGEKFLEELPLGTHALTEGTPDTIKLAVYGPDASIGPDTDVYTTSQEVSGGGYSAGGVAVPLTLVGISGSARAGGVQFSEGAYLQPTSDTSVPFAASGAARGILLYNASQSNRTIFVLDLEANFIPSVGMKFNWAVADVVNWTDVLIPLIGASF